MLLDHVYVQICAFLQPRLVLTVRVYPEEIFEEALSVEGENEIVVVKEHVVKGRRGNTVQGCRLEPALTLTGSPAEQQRCGHCSRASCE